MSTVSATPRASVPAHSGSLIRHWIQLGLGSVVGQVLGALSALVLRMLLSPGAMGVWQGCRLLLSYSNYASLGVVKAAARKWSVECGQGRTEHAQQAANVAWTVALLGSLAAAGAAAAAALWQWKSSQNWSTTWAAALALTALVIPLQRWVTMRVSLLRAASRFELLARLSVWEALWGLVLGAVGAWAAGPVGLVGATALGLLLAQVWLSRHRAPQAYLSWNLRLARELVQLGMPLVLGGAVFSLLRSVDKLVLLFAVPQGEYALGCYSVALLAQGQLFGLGNLLAGVLGPRLAGAWGRTKSRPCVALHAAETTRALALVMALPVGLAVLWGPVVLQWLLPQYRPGLPALKWLALGSLALVLALPGQHALVAVARPGIHLLLSALAAVVGFGATLGTVGPEPWEPVARAMCGTYWGFALAMLWVALRPAGPRALLHLPGVIAALAAPGAALGMEGVPMSLGVKSLIVLAAWAASLSVQWSWFWHLIQQGETCHESS